MNSGAFAANRALLAGYRRDAMLSRSRLACVVACLDALARVLDQARDGSAEPGVLGDLLGLCGILREAAEPNGGEGAALFAWLVVRLEELGHDAFASGGMPAPFVLEQMATIVDHLRATFALYAAEPRR